jgi:hypothetical protein
MPDKPTTDITAKVNKLYTEYWNSGISGQEFQKKIIVLLKQEQLALLERLEKIIDPDAYESIDQQIHNYDQLCEAILAEKERLK